jgi:hypothetical protein
VFEAAEYVCIRTCKGMAFPLFNNILPALQTPPQTGFGWFAQVVPPQDHARPVRVLVKLAAPLGPAISIVVAELERVGRQWAYFLQGHHQLKC